jgi:CRISPR/Cas system CSM-associated protein Csm2 small subunit
MTVQRDVVVKQLAELEVQGDEEGLIPAFNVMVNLLPVSFWNMFTERIIEATPVERRKEVEDALVECALVCGYNTGYGIITSEEFKSVVDPMVTDGAKDILRGAYAVFTAWGWAKSGIVQIKEGERMVVRGQDYYESDFKPDYLSAFMIRGVSSAFFDLAYGAPYPDGINTFKCEQTKGLEVGDPFGEFVVTKS